jgi:arylesterase / paraoxonase
MRLAGFFIILLLIAGAVVYGRLQSFNHFAEIEHSFDGQCTPVRGIAGPEDIQIDAKRSRAFISSLDRRTPGVRGAIHLFDWTNPLNENAWRDQTGGKPVAFQPLGIDLYDDGEVRRLFVVNNANKAVEMFDVDDAGALTHVETFTERRMTSPNNVVAVGRRSFYVTNDVKPGRGSRMGNLHFLTRATSGQVLFTDGTIWRVAADGLRFANGIEVSPDGARIYVAETAGNAIRIFERNQETGALALADIVDLNSAPDNIMVDASGMIWIAALPKPLTILRHGANPNVLSPSEVISIGMDGKARTVYRDDGTELSASTAAARLGDVLLIGALYDEKFLICRLPGDAF